MNGESTIGAEFDSEPQDIDFSAKLEDMDIQGFGYDLVWWPE